MKFQRFWSFWSQVFAQNLILASLGDYTNLPWMSNSYFFKINWYFDISRFLFLALATGRGDGKREKDVGQDEKKIEVYVIELPYYFINFQCIPFPYFSATRCFFFAKFELIFCVSIFWFVNKVARQFSVIRCNPVQYFGLRNILVQVRFTTSKTKLDYLV